MSKRKHRTAAEKIAERFQSKHGGVEDSTEEKIWNAFSQGDQYFPMGFRNLRSQVKKSDRRLRFRDEDAAAWAQVVGG